MKIAKRISTFCMALCLFLTLMPMPVKAEENSNNLKVTINDSENRRCDVQVEPGGSITLEVKVTADDTDGITYQWLDMNYDNIEGANTATYTVENVTEAAEYNCKVTDTYGNWVYAYAYVSVDNDLSAYINEKNNYNVMVAPHESVTLTVYASADNMDGITYQWKKGWEDIEGATTTTYTLEDVTEAAEYRCMVTDTYGNRVYAYARVGIDNGLSAYINEKSGYNVYEAKVAPHESVTLTVYASANNMDGITFQWEDENYDDIEGATTATYTVEDVTKAAEYRCMVTDTYGNRVYAYARVGIENGLSAYINEKNDYYVYEAKVAPHGSVTLTVYASADNADGITYQWLDMNYDDIEGATTATYTVEDVTEATEYICRVTDTYGNWVFASARIYIDNGLSVYINEKDNSNGGMLFTEVALHDSVTLTVYASANNMDGITYQWVKGNFVEIEGANTATYTIEDVTEAAEYRCVVKDSYGNYVFAYANIRVKNDLSLYINEKNENDSVYTVTVEPHDNVELNAHASAINDEGITYQWGSRERNADGSFPDYFSYEEIEGATSATYMVEDVTQAEWYICWVKDFYGNSWDAAAHICVDTGLKVAEEKVVVSGTEGEKTTLAMEASANEGVEIRYQWYKETAYTYNSAQYFHFQKLEDETGKELTIDKFENGAKYMCKAITYGEEKSTIFVLGEDDTDKDDTDKDDTDKDDTDKDNSNKDDSNNNNGGSGNQSSNPDTQPSEDKNTTTTTNEDGSVTSTKKETTEEGSNVTTAVTEKTDGSVETLVIQEKVDGSVDASLIQQKADGTVEVIAKTQRADGVLIDSAATLNPDGTSEILATVTWTDGSVLAQKETKNVDGTTTVITATANAAGEIVSSYTTVTALDGSSCESADVKSVNSNGKNVDISLVVNKDANGTVLDSTMQTVIANAAKNTSVVVNVAADGSGTVQKATGEITRTVDAGTKKATIAGSVVNQIKEAAGTGVKTDVSMKVVDESGKTLYTVKGKTSSLKAGTKLYLYRLDVKTGKYIAVTDDTYKVSDAGSVSLSMDKKATYELVTAKEAKTIQNEIKKTIALEKTSATLQTGKTTTVAFKDTLDKRSVKSITYTSSDKKVATVDNNGKVTAKAAGTADIKAKVTLNDGTTKTVTMKVTVK